MTRLESDFKTPSLKRNGFGWFQSVFLTFQTHTFLGYVLWNISWYELELDISRSYPFFLVLEASFLLSRSPFLDLIPFLLANRPTFPGESSIQTSSIFWGICLSFFHPIFGELHEVTILSRPRQPWAWYFSRPQALPTSRAQKVCRIWARWWRATWARPWNCSTWGEMGNPIPVLKMIWWFCSMRNPLGESIPGIPYPRVKRIDAGCSPAWSTAFDGAPTRGLMGSEGRYGSHWITIKWSKEFSKSILPSYGVSKQRSFTAKKPHSQVDINWEEMGWAENRREDMRWDKKRWDEMRCERRWEDTTWDDMRWDKKRWDEMRCERRWEDTTWDDMRWDKKRWDEMRCERRWEDTTWDDMRWDKKRWDEMRCERRWEDTTWDDMRWDKKRWDEMRCERRWEDTTWDDMRWDKKRWDEMRCERRWEDTTWDDMRWDKKRWDEMRCERRWEDTTWDDMRWDKKRWDEMRCERRWEDTTWDDMRWDKKRWDEMRCERRWEDTTWDDMRWDKKRWDEMRCERRWEDTTWDDMRWHEMR